MKKQIIIEPSTKRTIVDIEWSDPIINVSEVEVSTTTTTTQPATTTTTTQAPTTTTTTTKAPSTTTTTTKAGRNVIFQSLGGESDALGRWPVVGTSTSWGISKSNIGGRDALRFEVRKSDPIFAGGLRAEVNRYSDLNKPTYEVRYGLSYYVPTDWMNDQQNLFDIVHQWHDNTYNVAGETEYKSPFDFSIENGNWIFQVRYGTGTEKKFIIGAVEKGKWVDFIVHIKFVRTGTAGLVEIWKDGVKTNTYNGAVGFDHYNAPFFKMGIYKWTWNPENLDCCGATNSNKHVIYISNFRMGGVNATNADVA